MVGDPDRVEDVISILLDNASKYTPPHGRVSVDHAPQARQRRSSKSTDTGQGIPAEDLPRIFDRFFRSEASRAAGEGGFGLGLAILRSIVESMGGEIHVSSTRRRGHDLHDPAAQGPPLACDTCHVRVLGSDSSRASMQADIST